MNENKERNIITLYMVGIHRIFIIIRSSIKKPHNISLLEIIGRYCLSLKDGYFIEFKKFTSEIKENVQDDKENGGLLEDALNICNLNTITDNLHEIEIYLPVIAEAVSEISIQLKQQNFERAYDLLDANHCLPEAMINKKQWDSNFFWKSYISPYRKKWDKKFLYKKEKEIENSGLYKLNI